MLYLLPLTAILGTQPRLFQVGATGGSTHTERLMELATVGCSCLELPMPGAIRAFGVPVVLCYNGYL